MISARKGHAPWVHLFAVLALLLGIFGIPYWNGGAVSFAHSALAATAAVGPADLVTNGSFESPAFPTASQPVLGTNYNDLSSIPGWTACGASEATSVIEIGNSWLGTAQTGNQYVELNSNSPDAVCQTLTTTPGQTYQLVFYFSARKGTPSTSNMMDVSWAGQKVGPTITADGSTLSDTSWTRYSYTVTAASSSTVLKFADTGAATYGPDNCACGSLLDNVQVHPAPPAFSPGTTVSTTGMVVATDATWTVDGSASNAALVDPSCLNGAWLGAASLAPAKWIWNSSCSAGDGETHTFSKTFSLTAAPTQATLQLAADNYASVTINGTQVLTDAAQANGAFFGNFRTLDVTRALTGSTNTISITVSDFPNGCGSSSGFCNPAGLLARLVVQTTPYYSSGGTTAYPLGLTGQATPGATVGIYENSSTGNPCDGTPIGNPTADSRGNWTFGVSGLTQAVYTFGVQQSNSSGDSLCSNPISVVIDQSAPSSTITSPTAYVKTSAWNGGCGGAGGLCGTAQDQGGAGLAAVFVTIEKPGAPNLFWNGTAFTQTISWLPASIVSANADGSYNWQLGMAAPPQGTYGLGSGAIDYAGNLEPLLANSLCPTTDVSGLSTCYGTGGGLAPLGSGLAPLGGGLAPLGGGLAPLGGGLAPLGGGLPPVAAGGLAPLGGGLAPLGGGLAPLGGGVGPGGGLAPLGGGLAPLGSGSGTSNVGNVVVDDSSPVVSHFSVDGQDSSAGDNPVNINPSSATRVQIFFNEPMNCSTINTSSITVTTLPTGAASSLTTPTCVTGGLDNTAVFAGLQPSTAYTVTVNSAATDKAGNPLGTTLPGSSITYPLTFHFSTAAAPPPDTTTDSDNDGIPDAWDGTTTPTFSSTDPVTHTVTTTNTLAWGFTPTASGTPTGKDVCVVENYMTGNAANGTSYNQQVSGAANHAIVAAFQRHGIHLVIFEGDAAHSAGLPGMSDGPSGFPAYTGPWFGGAIPMVDPLGNTVGGNFDWTSSYTGTAPHTTLQEGFDQIRTERFLPTGLSQFCHYAVIAHTLGGTDSTGSSRDLGASDLVIALGGTSNGIGVNDLQVAGTLMHELGHNLGLHHGGGDDVNYKPNYLSVMNYSYQFTGVLQTGSSSTNQACTVGGLSLYCLLDYSDSTRGGLPALYENSLTETLSGGLGSGATGFAMKHRCPDPTSITGYSSAIVPNATGSIDWNCDGTLSSSAESYDVNGDTVISSTPMTSFSDWDHLNFHRGTIGLGASGGDSQGPQPTTSTIDVSGSTPGGVNSVSRVLTPEQYGHTLYLGVGTTCNGDAGHQILQPVNADGSSVFKQGSTIPLKFRVCGANGTSVGSTSFASNVVTTFGITKTVAGSGSVNETALTTTADTSFRWDSTNQQWIYNLSTKSLTAGNTYTYAINLNDGSSIPVTFGLR